jgi:hypothetical protein
MVEMVIAVLELDMLVLVVNLTYKEIVMVQKFYEDMVEVVDVVITLQRHLAAAAEVMVEPKPMVVVMVVMVVLLR